MKPKKWIIFALLCASVLLYWRPIETVQLPNPGNPDEEPTSAFTIRLPPFLVERQLSLKNMSRDRAVELYVQHMTRDLSYEGRVALSFYGKVVDEHGQSVEGASVRLEWNTIDVPGGTEFKREYSDANGLFSLIGEHGKCLGVRVSKLGYYTVDGGAGELSFEFADPSSPDWYEPEASKPVIFHLRKHGQGAPLFSKEITLPLNASHPQGRVNLMTGFIKPDGVLLFTSDTSRSLPGAQAFPWLVTLSMSEGGLIETNEQFPFEAPEGGYVPSVTMAMTNLDRNLWRGEMTKTYYFYLPSTNTYGRIIVDASSSLPLSLKYAYNKVPGNRVLEEPAK